MSTSAVTGSGRLAAGDEERGATILEVFDSAFRALLDADPAAFRGKFRKMAASPFAFYRGSACLFYADLDAVGGDGRGGVGAEFLDERTSRVWIHGDLHAENFGSYMDSRGRLVFNVNDFDEAYVGPYLWDVLRLVASLALLGHAKALSDAVITELVRSCAGSYRRRIAELAGDGAGGTAAERAGRLTLDTATGPLLQVLQRARSRTRIGLLDSQTTVEDYERHFTLGGGAFRLDDATRQEVLAALESYHETLPRATRARPESYRIKDVCGRRGVGIGSAGLPSYNILLEGHSEALENDVIIYLKQGQTPAVSRFVTDQRVREYFAHEGHRTVVSQRALQAHADPWLGWTTIGGVGQLVAEVSPYAVDLDWDEINEPAEIRSVVEYLGAAAAAMHAVADDESGHSLVPFSTEEAIHQAVSRDPEGFDALLVDFAHGYGARTRADHRLFVDLFRNGRIAGL
ncbi:DUF2252 domain-containing protein [Allostreptomyces psammosilenae]|uniref:Uncharacterized protein (DUF2252 family) n=1 Tax=Allostreptomyces psammosilenae TaxID=1892865 RepID=A0A852ZZ62_9ACTN|nr:DUF2252 domain-containing protein [Allostreptomyces psammosilenae]NYI07117.1 uncharacterized protein (DUF2252 family) [Allostreptomyces psammosilenae]